MDDVTPEVATIRRTRLKTLEAEIEQGMEKFYYVGMKLKQIKDEELYKDDGFKTFAEYVRKRWEWSRQHCDRLIQSAKIRGAIPSAPIGANKTDGYYPQWSEASVRELGRIKNQDGEVDAKEAAKVAHKVIAHLGKNAEEKLTARVVRRFVDEDLGVKRGKKAPAEPPLSRDLHELLRDYAASLEGMRENLEPIPLDSWRHMRAKHPIPAERLAEECERLAALLRRVVDECSRKGPANNRAQSGR
jgi:hypothetical protein